MTRNTQPILSIESAPGDTPRAVEQANGDLLIPAHVRPLLELTLRQVAFAMQDYHGELPALKEAQRLLGIEAAPAREAWALNLYRVRAI